MKGIYYGWWVVGGAFLLFFCAAGTQFYAFPVFFDAIIRDTEWSRAQASAALSIGMLVKGVSAPLLGLIIGKTGVKTVTVFGSIMAGLGFVLLFHVSTLWQFYVFYGLILSIGIACMTVIPSMTAVQSWFVEKRSLALGIASTGIGAGGTVIPPLAGWLIFMYGWQTSFLFMAAIVALIGIPVSAGIMRTADEKKLSLSKKAEEKDDTEAVALQGLPFNHAVKTRAFWCVSVGAMLWGWSYTAGLAHQVAFAVDMGIERTIAAGAVGLLCTFSIFGRLGFGKLGDIIDKRFVFMAATSLQIIAFIVLMNTTNATMLYIYSFLIGVNIGGFTPILPGLIADHFGARYFSVIYGVSFFIFNIGLITGPVYAGWIFDTTGYYSFAFLTSIVMSCTAIVIIYLAGRPQEARGVN